MAKTVVRIALLAPALSVPAGGSPAFVDPSSPVDSTGSVYTTDVNPGNRTQRLVFKGAWS